MWKSRAKKWRPLLPHGMSHLTHLWWQARSHPRWNWKNLMEYQCWRCGWDLMSGQTGWAPWHLILSDHRECNQPPQVSCQDPQDGNCFPLGKVRHWPCSRMRAADARERPQDGWNICHCPLWVLRGGNQTPSALCTPTHSQIFQQLLCFCISAPLSCAYGHIYGKNAILQVHSLLGGGSKGQGRHGWW